MSKTIYIDENGTEQVLSSSPSALNSLSDVTITNPSNNQVLVYDNGTWKNKTISVAEHTVSGAIASFNTNLPIPLKECIAEIEPNLSGVSAVNVTNKDDLDNPTEVDTYTINLGGTYYGGTLDVTTGELTVKYARVDLGSLSWNYTSSYNGVFYTYISGKKAGYNNFICDEFTVSDKTYPNSYMNLDNMEIVGTESTNSINVRDDSYTSASSFTTAMSGKYLTYELATPTTVQLTPTQIKTLLGNNNIFADSGDIEVEYYDIGLV